MGRLARVTALAGIGVLACASLALAQAPNGTSLGKPTQDGGNALVNGGAGAGTGTASPGPGMTLKDGSNPQPTAAPTANGGNTDVNQGKGSGTGTAEPRGDR